MDQIDPDSHESDPHHEETKIEREDRRRREAFERWCKGSYNPTDGSPPFIGAAMRSVAKTLHGAWLLVRQEFGERAQPEHAVMLLSAIESERLRIERDSHRRAQDECDA